MNLRANLNQTLNRFSRRLIAVIVIACLSGAAQNSAYGQSPKSDLTTTSGVDSKEEADSTKNGIENESRFAADRYSYEKKGAIQYAEGSDYQLNCDLYLPRSKTGEPLKAAPVVIAIHGGAWRNGTKISMLRHAIMLARRGYAVMSINYRLAPKHPFPAQIHDCKQAVRWIRHHAEEYNIDPEQVIVFGYSAGGHLACLMGTAGEGDGLEGEVEPPFDKYDSTVQAVIAGGSPCEFSWIGANSTQLMYWIGATRSQNQDAYDLASPITHVSKEDPPFYLFHGEQDWIVPKESSERFATAIEKIGGKVKLQPVKGSGHIFAFSDTTCLLSGIVFVEKTLELGQKVKPAPANDSSDPNGTADKPVNR